MVTGRQTCVLYDGAEFSISGIRYLPKAPDVLDCPLIIAVHGGGFTARYFDVPGYSLVERCGALNIPILALNRPGYGGSTPLPISDSTILRNAERLDQAIGSIWQNLSMQFAGIVLIGHSIGGAIVVAMASRHPDWPLLGVAISGVGLVVPPGMEQSWSSLPEVPMIDLPIDVKNELMFGPRWTHDDSAPRTSQVANAPVPRAELIDIVTAWPTSVRELAARVEVPVHYRQAEFEKLWVTNEDEVVAFGASFTSAREVDARIYRHSGHCIDLHRVGASFQLNQLAFALGCAAARR
jgi:pimeloyl-ACP methyl ester carboxylesterase